MNVWACIIDEHTGTRFIYGKLAVEKYLSMIRDELVTALVNLYSNPVDPILPNVNVWSQHDGTPFCLNGTTSQRYH